MVRPRKRSRPPRPGWPSSSLYLAELVDQAPAHQGVRATPDQHGAPPGRVPALGLETRGIAAPLHAGIDDGDVGRPTPRQGAPRQAEGPGGPDGERLDEAPLG